MSDDDIHPIPSIVPTRDSEHARAAVKPRPGVKGHSTRAGVAASAQGAGVGLMVRLIITLSLVVAAVACAWAWQLQEQLAQSNFEMQRDAQRISDLEDRLSDTDEGLSQNTATMAVKIKELYSEVDKLWASAWRKNKAKIATLEGKSAVYGNKIAGAESSIAAARGQLKTISADMAKMKKAAADIERLTASSRASQSEVERVADTLNRINLDLARLDKRVKSNEEWVGSINAFRKQVNASLNEIQTAVRALQAPPAAGLQPP